MTRPLPAHGTRACYLRGCRRPECSDAHYRYMSRYRYEYDHGQRRRVDTAAATNHARALVAAGWSRRQIADAAHVSHGAARTITEGRYPTTRADIAQRILALPITAPPVGDGRFTPATGTVRRLRALMVIGHTLADIAKATGIHRGNLGQIARWAPDQVETRTARAVATAYRQMSTRPGTAVRPGASTRARNIATSNNWHGPLAWDDIDNPDEQPDTDGVATPRALKKRTQPEEIAAEVRHLAGLGESVHFIAKQLGRSEKRITQLMPGYEEAA